MSHDTLTADEIIAHLKLGPHPEGGYFRETFRDRQGPRRAALIPPRSSICCTAGEISRWHRVDAAELWHWYGGAPLLLGDASRRDAGAITLGPDWLQGQHPHALVPAGSGRAREPRAPGRSRAAPWRRASTSRASNWLQTVSSPERGGSLSRRVTAVSGFDTQSSASCASKSARASSSSVGGVPSSAWSSAPISVSEISLVLRLRTMQAQTTSALPSSSMSALHAASYSTNGSAATAWFPGRAIRQVERSRQSLQRGIS